MPKAKHRKRVTLNPPPWKADARLARPALELAEGPLEVERGRDGDPVARRARVWRTPVTPMMRALPEPARAALIAYADAAERLAASGGTADPTAGGGRPTPTGPSLARLAAAERLALLDATLGGHRFVVASSARPPVVTEYRDLVRWVAVEGASRAELEDRVGLPRRDEWRARLSRAIGEAAHLLAVRLGLDGVR